MGLTCGQHVLTGSASLCAAATGRPSKGHWRPHAAIHCAICYVALLQHQNVGELCPLVKFALKWLSDPKIFSWGLMRDGIARLLLTKAQWYERFLPWKWAHRQSGFVFFWFALLFFFPHAFWISAWSNQKGQTCVWIRRLPTAWSSLLKYREDWDLVKAAHSVTDYIIKLFHVISNTDVVCQ